MEMWWEDYLGNKWDFTSEQSGVYLLGDAQIKGLHMPPLTRYVDKSPSLAGSRFRGYDTEEREVVWPLRVYNDVSSQAWIEHDNRFWDTLHPERTGKWYVRQPNGQARYLTLRFVDDPTTFNVDPALVGWQIYSPILAAERPFWQGKVERRTFGPAGVGPWLSPPNSDSVFQISRARNVETATVKNDGDVDAYPRWWGIGPSSSMQFGVGADTIQIPFALGVNDWVYVDTSTDEQVVYRGHVKDGEGNPLWEGTIDDVTSQCIVTGFARLPFKSVSTLATAITTTGSGEIRVEFTNEYLRAW